MATLQKIYPPHSVLTATHGKGRKGRQLTSLLSNEHEARPGRPIGATFNGIGIERQGEVEVCIELVLESIFLLCKFCLCH